MSPGTIAGTIVSILIPLSLIIVFSTLFVYGTKGIVKLFLEAEKNRIHRALSKTTGAAYVLFGALIFIVPPQYFKESYNYDKYGKFAAIWKVKSIDYVMMSFEVVGYIILGVALYFFFTKLCKDTRNNKTILQALKDDPNILSTSKNEI